MSELIHKQIEKYAAKEWPDDAEMQEYTIEEELNAHGSFMLLSKTNSIDPKLIQQIFQEDGTVSWCDRLSSLEIELEAGEKIRELIKDAHLPQEVLLEILDTAEKENPVSIYERHVCIEAAINQYRRDQYIATEVAPRRELLISLENILARSCSNYHADNYRYPLTISSGIKQRKIRLVDDSVSNELLLTGSYEFGANSLEVYKALLEMIRHIEERYGVNLKAPSDD